MFYFIHKENKIFPINKFIYIFFTKETFKYMVFDILKYEKEA